MATIAFLLDTDFEQVEYTQPKQLLEQNGHTTVLITTQKQKQVQGLNHTEKGDTFNADLLIDDAKIEAYDALVLPGGTVNADALRFNSMAQTFVKEFYATGKTIAAICHAPWVFVDTQIAKGKNLTAYKTIAIDLKNAGATYQNKAVVVDGNLITSREPNDIPDFVKAIDTLLQK